MTALFELEKEIARMLLVKLEHLDISLERASAIARFVLAHLPDDFTDEQVEKIIPSLDDEFWELSEIVHNHMQEYEEKYKQKVEGEIEDLIKHRHFEEAGKLAKDYFTNKFIPVLVDFTKIPNKLSH